MSILSIKSLIHRRIPYSVLPILLYSILILGAARLVLDSLKSYKSQVIELYVGKKRLPVVVLPKDRIEENCNVFEGRWEWDNVSYPLYEEESCPYLGGEITCQKNGRPDSFYMNWRWQPHGCNLPRFDPLKLLHMLRDKRMMLIGDSLQRGQFESMICLVQSVIPEGKKSLQTISPMKIFKAEEFNASIEYYWAPFIVESLSDHPTNHTAQKRLVSLDSIDNHGKHWEGVDILVFESYAWWMYKPFINATYGSHHKVQEYNPTTAYKLALKTWSHWLESNIQPLTQKVFFMTMSPLHMWSWEWKPGSDGNCFNESYPIQGGPYWGRASNLKIMEILHDALQELKIDVTLLNITQLSEYRKDAHTSVYGERKGKLLTKEQRANRKAFPDCMHWCLPGVPDAWNEILYAYLLKNYQNFS